MIFDPTARTVGDFCHVGIKSEKATKYVNPFAGVPTSCNVQDLPSDPEILPDVAGCSTTQSDSGNISQFDPEFLPDDTSVQTSTCKPVGSAAAFPYPSISNLHTRRRRYMRYYEYELHYKG